MPKSTSILDKSILQEYSHYVKGHFVFMSFLDYIIEWLQPSHTLL